MKMGYVKFEIGYFVDLDNQEMVDHAKEAIIEDVAQAAICYGMTFDIEERPDADEGEIPEFLSEEVEDV